MFRLIGIIVVIAVCITAYSSIEKWYEGRATPAETVVNIRDQVGAALKPDSQDNHVSAVPSTEINQHQADENNSAQTSSEEFSTEKAARNLITHAND